MTPRERVEIVLAGGHADCVPFTIYENHVLRCTAEREMRNRGLCLVCRVQPFTVRRPNVRTTQQVYWEDGKRLVRTFHETPVGTLTGLDEPQEFTTWHHEKLFKGPDDYKAIAFFLNDPQFAPDYRRVAQAQEDFGPDAIFRAGFGYEPMQMLISGGILDTADFCVEWMDRRDEILTLYDILVAKRREVYPLVAASPIGHANYGGNVVPEIIGLEAFQKYFVPHYNEAAEVMHAHGKLIGCHFDANCRLLAEAIAATDLDYVEAFTPAPDSDMTLAEAREAWKEKVLWLNFPSSVHLRSDEQVERVTVEMLETLEGVDGLIMGITEDIPLDRWQASCRAIMDGLARHAAEHPGMYEKKRA